MAVSNTMRLLNVLLLLRNTSRPLTRAEIMRQVDGYNDGDDDSAQRKFERDKSSIRRLVKLEVVEGEDGLEDSYRIDEKATFMPEIPLTGDEQIVMHLASKAWGDLFVQQAANAGAIYSGVAEARTVRAIFAANEKHFAELNQANIEHRVVEFDYFSRSSSEVKHRVVDPWILALHDDHWYLYGLDHESQSPRLFRLTRIRSAITTTGESISSPAPTDIDISAIFDAYQRTEPEPTVARIRVPVRECANLRIMCSKVLNEGDFDVLEIVYIDGYRLSRQIALVADRAQVLEPAHLRAQVDEIISATVRSNS